jgi:putative nucleotidyltransferase with HDIG domain
MELAERRGELCVGGGFACVALAIALTSSGGRSLSLPIAGLYVLGLAAAGHIRIDVGSGFTVPTQAVFVPLLFAAPVALVPLLVALALVLGMLPAVVARDVSPSRLLTVPANSWFALGPAAVLLLAGEPGPAAKPAVLLLALLAQFAGDFAASAVRERLCGGISIRDLAGEVREVYLIDLALAPLGLAVALAAVGHHWAVLLIAPLFGILRLFSKERRARLEQLIELGDAYRGTALVLGDVVEADDTYTGEHCKGVVRLALDVAGELQLDARQYRNVEFGALLHDVGKIAVPKEIINKPGKLDEREWEIIKTHTIEGQKMLERVGGFMREVGEIVRSSHERWDGGGYPDGLRGAAIPLEARIVSACDAFNAMTTTRSYRRAMPLGDAIAELSGNAGTQFDPLVVEALVRLLGREPIAAADADAS